VVLVAREGGDLEEVARGIRAEGGEAWVIAADVGEKEAIHRIAGVAAAVVGQVDLLINNAATLGPVPMPLLADTECEDVERVLAVNLVGAFRLTKAVIGSMLLRERGVVINVSSDAAIVGYPGWGAYGVSKAGLEQMGRIWAAEMERAGVRIVTVDPGEMDTQMHAEAVPDADRRTLTDPEEAARWIVGLVRRIEEIPSGGRFDLSRENAAAGGGAP
jgi:NAD(P)-dependent dehydrogenase (short-subunit alcohol dehydrogenase family)